MSEKKSNNWMKWGCVLGIIGFLFSGLFFVFTFLFIIGMVIGFIEQSQQNMGNSYVETYVEGNTFAEDKIAVIDLSGIIVNSSSDWSISVDAKKVVSQFRYLENRKDIKAIVLKIDSPGGEVTASDEIYHAIEQYREKTGCPVISCMGSLAASGGYYIACATDYIICNRSTMTGSIGVIISGFSYHELMDNVGVKSKVFKSGKLKDVLSGSRPSTTEEDKFVQDLVDKTFDQFAHVVSKGRKIPLAKVKAAPIGDARIVLGVDAVKMGLADSIGYLEDAIAEAVAKANLQKDYKVIQFENEMTLSSLLLNMKNELRPAHVNINLPGNNGWRSMMQNGRLYFMPDGLQ